MSENEISKIIVDCCFKIHTKLGPGLLESVYEEVLCYELEKNNLKFVRQNPVKIIYEDVTLNIGFIADIIVEDKLILELKSVETLKNVHFKQLLTYLRLNNKKLGLLINFNENLIKNGIKRIVNNL
ncbi:MAG: GxxExxY protein [Ignavibacteria bacterium]|nr:GxxExxY protein [Ignavibacteria bacterium]